MVRRGMLYSGIMMMIIFVFLSIMILQKENVSQERQTFSLGQEIEGVDASYRSIERSLHTLSDVSLRRAVMISQNSVIAQNDSFFKDGQKAPDVLKQLMWNGTLPNQTLVAFMVNNTLQDNILILEDYYSREPRKYNISISVNYSDFTVGLSDSFSIFFNMTAEVNISKEGVANFSRILNIFEKVSVVGFEDPLYLVNVTGGKLSRAIIRNGFANNFTQRISLVVSDGDGNCYGALTDNISDSQKSEKIFFNDTIYPYQADSFCGVIYESGSSPNTSYLEVGSVADLSALNGQKLLLLGDGEYWGITDGLFNVSNFIDYVHAGGYVNSSSAPSFFDMLEGSPECTYCTVYGPVGLDTILDKNSLSAPELYITVNNGASNSLYEYLHNTSGHKTGMNESSADESFYEFRMDDSMRDYFR